MPAIGYPTRIYVVHDGVVYRAKPTNPGVSYHAFPETSEELQKLPRATLRAIRERADALGCLVQVNRWIRG